MLVAAIRDMLKTHVGKLDIEGSPRFSISLCPSEPNVPQVSFRPIFKFAFILSFSCQFPPTRFFSRVTLI
jgi:hypothetical protein